MSTPFDHAPLNPEPWRADISTAITHSAASLPEPPRRRFSAVAFVLGLLAWIVIIAGVANIVIDVMADSKPRTAEGKESLNLVAMRTQVQTLLGFRELMPTMFGNDQQVYAGLKPLNTGPIDQRLRFAIVAGELQGPVEALKVLKELEELIERVQPPVMLDQELQRYTLWQLYTDYTHLRYDAPTITTRQRDLLRDQLGWFGELALAPAGQPGVREQAVALAGGPAADGIVDVPPDPTQRVAMLEPAIRMANFIWWVAVVLLSLLVLGSCGLLVFGILIAFGVVRGGVKCGTSPAGVYVEAFALWLLVFVACKEMIPRLAIDPMWGSRLLVLIELCSLAVVFWPVVRGVPWRKVREDLGLTLGRRPLLEPGFGVGSYIMSYPILLIGIAVFLLITAAVTMAKGVQSPDDLIGPSNPAHPAVEPLLRGDWLVRLQFFVLACIIAPLMEETLFRGVLYRHLRELTHRLGNVASITIAALVSSIIFAIIHPQGLLAAPLLTSLACGFVLAREWRGTLIPGMVAHGLHNGLTLWMAISVMGN